MNLRVGKTISFGKVEGAFVQEGGRQGGGRQGGGANPGRGRYNLSIQMQMQNILNHNNPGPITGNITSPIFGHANQPAGGGGGFGGFSEAANNRRLELQTRFTF